jgi:DNA-binding HxlR family transcriptional regulator
MGEVYEPRSGCPINATIEVFGDRWSLLVLRDIVVADRRYFRELQAGSQEVVGHAHTCTTEKLYRKELRPVRDHSLGDADEVV